VARSNEISSDRPRGLSLRTLAVESRANSATALVDDVRLLEHFLGDAALELHEAEPLALLAFTDHFRIQYGTEALEVLPQRLPCRDGIEPADKDLAIRVRRVRDR